MDYFVEIVRLDDDEAVVERMGPMGERAAESVADGVDRNINWELYFVRIVRADA